MSAVDGAAVSRCPAWLPPVRLESGAPRFRHPPRISRSSYQSNLPNISIMTLLCSLFSEFTMCKQAVPVGDMLPMRCHEVEEMFFIPDGRCTVRRARGGKPAPGGRDFLQPPIGLRHERHRTSDVDCQVQTLLAPSPPRRPRHHNSEPPALQAAVSQAGTV